MNDPHSHTPQASGCGCSGQSTTEPAAATVPPAPAACCSGGAADGPPETAQNDEHHPEAGGCCAGGKVSEGAATVTDPVCGMTVDPARTAHHSEHAGQTFHFCSAGCRTKFGASPDAYLGDKSKPEPTAAPGPVKLSSEGGVRGVGFGSAQRSQNDFGGADHVLARKNSRVSVEGVTGSGESCKRLVDVFSLPT